MLRRIIPTTETVMSARGFRVAAQTVRNTGQLFKNTVLSPCFLLTTIIRCIPASHSLVKAVARARNNLYNNNIIINNK